MEAVDKPKLVLLLLKKGRGRPNDASVFAKLQRRGLGYFGKLSTEKMLSDMEELLKTPWKGRVGTRVFRKMCFHFNLFSARRDHCEMYNNPLLHSGKF